MKRRNPLNPWLVLAFVGGLCYPPLVYYGMGVVSPRLMVAVGLGLLAARLAGLRHRPEAKIWIGALIIGAIGLAVLSLFNALMAAQAYPVIVSLSVAAIFVLSLIFPPPLVERIARLSEPDLSPQGVAYTRRVTMIWAVFLVANACVSAATALWGTLAQWTLWNGLVSYLAMGALFVGEWLVRQKVRRCF